MYFVHQGWFDGDGSFGCGVVLSDLDGDDRPDFLCTGALNGTVGLFRNTGGGNFESITTSGIRRLYAASGVSAADYDGDGDLDLFFTNWLEPDVLYRNDGEMHFTDVTQ